MARPRRYDTDLRRRLLDVSSEAISRRGPDGISLRVVAAAAGTSTAAVYALFGGREELIEAVAAEGFARFGAHLDAVAHTDDAGADLLALGLAYRTSALADPHFYQVMFGVAAAAQPAQRTTFEALHEGVQRLHPGDTEETEEIAYRLWSVVHGLVSLELAGMLPGVEHERAERYAQTLRAVGPALFRPQVSA